MHVSNVRIVRIVILLSSLVAYPALTPAATVQYHSRSDFETAIDAQPIVDFDSYPSLSSYNGVSLDVGPFTLFQDTGFTGALTTGYPNGAFHNGTRVGASYVRTGTSLYFLFDEPITAFGADFWGLNDNVQRSYFIVGGETIAPPILAGTYDSSFFGFVLDVPVDTVQLLTHGAADAYYFDNVTFQIVPEPATLYLSALAMSLLGCRVLWRRQRQAAG